MNLFKSHIEENKFRRRQVAKHFWGLLQQIHRILFFISNIMFAKSQGKQPIYGSSYTLTSVGINAAVQHSTEPNPYK